MIAVLRYGASILGLTVLLVGTACSAAGAGSGEERERLRNRLEAEAPLLIGADREPVYAEETLRLFYQRRAFQPAWTDPTGPLAAADSLVAALKSAAAEGLRPQDYHLSSIVAGIARYHSGGRQRRVRDPRLLVDLEFLLTDAFLVYGAHCLAGRVDPVTIDPEWVAARRGGDLAAALEDALAGGQVRPALRGLLPAQPGYARLRAALARYRDIARKGSWKALPEGPALHPGDVGPAVAALRARLQVTGDLVESGPDSSRDVFDAEVTRAVQGFQQRHGLKVDAVVGAATRRALDVPAGERIGQILVNLERWRWLPADLGRRHLLVNIADFHLDLVEDGRRALTLPVIVGRTYRRTPVFSARMTYLVFCPSWEVPPSLALQDIVPQIRKDPGYLERLGFQVLQGWGVAERAIDPDSVSWNRLPPDRFPYRLRQKPGPLNALGHVKFMFPNKFNVYLHDTPGRDLFSSSVRTFSSGCIRVQRPEELAEAVLAGDPRWTPETIRSAMVENVEQTVPLPVPLPVHVLYWTVWVDEGGVVNFRADIYGRDRLLADALAEPPPDLAQEEGGPP
jgi:murein L,D-transpeptidase YcbB/YkuD